MCGIFGMAAVHGQRPDRGLLEKMGDAIVHRGPDDAGFFVSGPVGLGMRRLSIIDLAGGHQPIFNEARDKVIVFNGEIYNFHEIREGLQKKGHSFTTNSDTEAILHLYEEKGESCVEDLVGMFAFAIWDIEKESLFLARDRFGEKPLHYYWDGRRFIFASEIKSMLCDEGVDRSLDWGAVGDYFTFMNTIAPDTVFKGIKKLMPGHYMVFEGGRIRQERYWSYCLDAGRDKGEQYYKSSVLEHLKKAVEGQLISDVPLGAFLSGGIDSGAIVALMSMAAGTVKTFSIGFEETGYNELGFAKEVAQAFGTDHHEYILRPDAVEVVDKIIMHLDEPFCDPSAIPTYFVSKIARQEVKVALSGDGGDEVFAGYPGYRAEYLLNKAAKLPGRARRAFTRGLLEGAPALPWARFNYGARRLGRILERVDMSPADRFFSRHRLFSDDEKRALFTSEIACQGVVKDQEEYLRHVEFGDTGDPVDIMLALDANIYLPNDMLVKIDRMSMAHSLEVRTPFLDHRLAGFMAATPSRYKVRGMTTKYILREAMRGILPDSVLKRGKKGFSVPLDAWFRNDLAGYAREILLDGRTAGRGFFNMKRVAAILDSHTGRKEDRSGQIWALIVFEKWCRMFLDGETAH